MMAQWLLEVVLRPVCAFDLRQVFAGPSASATPCGAWRVIACSRRISALVRRCMPRKWCPDLEAVPQTLSKIGKRKPGLKINFEKAIGAIMEAMHRNLIPSRQVLPDKSQALFGLGYYHQRNEFFKKFEKFPRRRLPDDCAATAMTSSSCSTSPTGNPNGDPGRRQPAAHGPETNKGLVSDVSLKRKIRKLYRTDEGRSARLPHLRAGGSILNEKHRKLARQSAVIPKRSGRRLNSILER